MKRCLVVFAKEPRGDKVKTRLKGILSESRRLDLYRAFLKDTIAIAAGVECEMKMMAYESGGRAPHYLKTLAAAFQFYEQKGKDLGERMHHAFAFARRKGAEETVIIGSDSPTLPADYIRDAFGHLKTADVVLGPSLDGGYYLIGLKKPCLALFKNILWSSETVFGDTLENARKSGKRIVVLDYWYDVDKPSDLIRLRQDLEERENKDGAQATKEFLKFCKLSYRRKNQDKIK